MKIWTCGSSPRSGSRNAWTRIKNVNGASRLSNIWNFFGAIQMISCRDWRPWTKPGYITMTRRQSNNQWSDGMAAHPAPKNSECKNQLKKFSPRFFGTKRASSSLLCDRKDCVNEKIPMTPSGIEPQTFRFVAQHVNHCATALPITCLFNSAKTFKWASVSSVSHQLLRAHYRISVLFVSKLHLQPIQNCWFPSYERNVSLKNTGPILWTGWCSTMFVKNVPTSAWLVSCRRVYVCPTENLGFIMSV